MSALVSMLLLIRAWPALAAVAIHPALQTIAGIPDSGKGTGRQEHAAALERAAEPGDNGPLARTAAPARRGDSGPGRTALTAGNPW
jgi:hypothetical protein